MLLRMPPPLARWTIAVGIFLVFYPLLDYVILRHAGTEFYPYVVTGLERTHVLSLGAAIIFVGCATTPWLSERLTAAYSHFGWSWATLLIAVFTAFTFFINRIQIDPFETILWQEYTHFIIGHRPENIGIHPLFSDRAYLPPIYLLPFSVLSSTLFQILAVAICWLAPPVILLHTLRKIGFHALCATLIVLLAFFVGISVLQGFMLLPNPFYYNSAIDFRMTLMLCVSLMGFFLASRRWLLAGIFLGLAVVSHVKFGLRLWGLATLVMVTLSFLPRLQGPSLTIRQFIKFQIGFIVVFAAVAWSVGRAIYGSTHLHDPAAHELISALGWLIKNEPDDWLFLSYPDTFIGGNLLLAVAAVLLCAVIVKFIRAPNMRILGSIGLIAAGISLLLLLLEIAFEAWGLSVLPWQVSLAYLLNRPWEFLWVPPLILGVAGGALLFGRPRSSVLYYVLVTLALGLYFGKQVQRIATSPQQFHTIAELTPPAAIIDYSVLQICSQSAAERQQAATAAIAALKDDKPSEFAAAISQMRGVLAALKVGDAARPPIDLEAENLIALHQMREGDYAAAYANLRRQDREIRRLTPQDPPWAGDIVWHCDPGQKQDSIAWKTVDLSWPDFVQALAWLSRHAPAGAGIIQPASLEMVSSISGHPAFWQTKVDSHAMYLYPGYYPIGLYRLNLVAGAGATELSPGFRNGDPGEAGRLFFQKLTAEDFARIHERYKSYRFILTEAGDQLDLPKVFSNATFSVYTCCSGD